MGYRSYEWKIIYVLVLVFVLIQAGVFIGLSNQNKNIASETLELELNTGAAVLDRLLRLRHRQLEQSARVLAADLQLRDALLREDLFQAQTLLLAHEGRIDSALLLLTDLNNQQLLTIPSSREPIDPAHVVLLPEAYAQAAREPLTALINSNSDLIYQIITVPVSSTHPIAWLTVGFTIADSLVQTLESVANTNYSFLSQRPGEPWVEHVSTFAPGVTATLLPQFDGSTAQAQELSGSNGDYLVVPFVLSSFADIELVAMVGKSLDQAMHPFNQLQRTLFYWVLAGALISAIAIFAVTRRMVGPLNTMAHVDLLTGLANRRVFEASVNKLGAIGDTAVNSPSSSFAIMLMDMNDFQHINQHHGHTMGDEVLKIIAERLRDTLRKSDLIARYGGDEFAVLMHNVDKDSCARVAEMILESLERSIEVDGVLVEVGISIGIAVSPEDGNDRNTLLKNADLAMHSAKSSGRGFAFYTP